MLQSACLCCCDQPRLTLCNPMDCSPPGSSVHEVLQARTLEWFAMPSSRGIFLTQGLNPCFLCLLHWQAGSSSWVPPKKQSDVTPNFSDLKRQIIVLTREVYPVLADVGVLFLVVTRAQADGAPSWTWLTKQIQWYVSHPWLLELLADRVHSTSPPSLLTLTSHSPPPTSEGAAKGRPALYQEGATRTFATREILLIHGMLQSFFKGIAPATSLPSY